MNNSALHAVIQEYGKERNVPAIMRLYPEIARLARDGEYRYEEFLKQVLEAEAGERRGHCAEKRIRQALFPDRKTLDQINWTALWGIAKPNVLELASCEYVEQGHDVVLAGPIGTEKTHLAIALGMEAARRRYRVAFTRASDLVRDLMEAKDERTLGRLHQRCLGVSLLIVDELGFTPFDKTEGELLFNLLADRYERRSTIVTTNLDFGEWVQVFSSEKLATALLYRLIHHAQILTTKGASYRTRRKSEKNE
ncbi:MAG: IS21-like element helper ATPase IstB [Candidatus Omnitrophota bacterium]